MADGSVKRKVPLIDYSVKVALEKTKDSEIDWLEPLETHEVLQGDRLLLPEGTGEEEDNGMETRTKRKISETKADTRDADKAKGNKIIQNICKQELY